MRALLVAFLSTIAVCAVAQTPPFVATPEVAPADRKSSTVTWLGQVASYALFTANSNEHGTELWRTDGTLQGTSLVADLIPGPEGAFDGGVRNIFGVLGGRKLLFSGPTHVYESDGTAAGTRKLDAIDVGSTRHFIPLGDWIYFLKENVDWYYRELWRTDGTLAGTQRVDLRPAAPLDVSYIWTEDELLYFAGDFENGEGGVYKTDGTVAGTALVPSYVGGWRVATRDIAITAGRDGVTLKSRSAGAGSLATYWTFKSGINSPYVANGRLFIRADDGIHGTELWSTDGTAQGTEMVDDFAAGSASSTMYPMATIGRRTIFVATDASGTSYLGSFEGFAGPVMKIRTFWRQGSGFPPFFTVRDRVVLKLLDTPADSGALWTTDGTAAGTALLRGPVVEPDVLKWPTSGFVRLGDRVVFTAERSSFGGEPFITDGTSEGTFMLRNIYVEATPRRRSAR